MTIFGFLRTPPKEELETRELIRAVRALREARGLDQETVVADLATSVMELAGEERDVTPGMRVGIPVFRLIRGLFLLEPFGFDPPDESVAAELSLKEGAKLREKLRRARRMLSEDVHYFDKWRHATVCILAGLYRDFPPHAFVDPDSEGNFEEPKGLAPEAPLYTFVPNVRELLQKIIGTILARDLMDEGLFYVLRDQLLTRMCVASGTPPEDRYRTDRSYVLPLEKSGVDDAGLVELYLKGTLLYELLTLPVPLRIPEAVRFEHTHVVAGTGHGKTQALQFLIASDLEQLVQHKRSVVVMDSQGDLLHTLMHSSHFLSADLRERLIYIDPTEFKRPVGLNLFDFDLGQAAEENTLERETILNGTIELYEYFFGGLLGAELTQKQGVIFRYIAMLLTRIPGANVHTLRELMEDGEKFRPYMATLQGSARTFFETRFFDRTFVETKKQILMRLWGVFSIPALDRMMSARKNSIDLYRALLNGSVVFINTAKDFLGHEGSVIFGRMFVALLGQALVRRAALPRHSRTPTYIYIDEAEDVMDLTLVRLLAQVRKYKGAITFAHQNLDQLEPTIRSGVIANTSIKLAGGLSAKDANTLAPDLRTSADFLLSQRRSSTHTHFACHARNVTERAVTLSIPLGYIESQKQLDKTAFENLIELSRVRYGVPVEKSDLVRPSSADSSPDSGPAADIPVAKPAQTVQPAVVQSIPEVTAIPAAGQRPDMPVPDRGVKHRYLQHLVKELGEERGFRATLEAAILDGAGRVDVLLIRDDIQIAFEISVTTTKDHELGNIEKCLALPYTHVVMLTSYKRRRTGLAGFIGDALTDEDKKRVSFLLPEDLPAFLDGYPAASPTTVRKVKGYAVKSHVKAIDPVEAIARRRAIAAVVARSIQEGEQ